MGKYTNGHDPYIERPEGFPKRSESGGPADQGGCRKAAAVIAVIALSVLGGGAWGVVELVRAVAS
jgi:hypothetical protein